MNGLIRYLLTKIRQSLYIWGVAGGVFLGTLFLGMFSASSGHIGVLLFLLSPFLLPIIAPQLSDVTEDDRASILLGALLFPLFAGLIFLTTFLMFGGPRPLAGMKGVLFLTSFSILLTGLMVGVQRMGASTFVARWTSTVIGLLLVGSFIYLSPFADHFYNRPQLRNGIIALATQCNPVLAMSGGILEQDLLRGAFLYEHLSIGRYYSYSAPSWETVGMVYTVIGILTGSTGLCMYRSGGEKV